LPSAMDSDDSNAFSPAPVDMETSSNYHPDEVDPKVGIAYGLVIQQNDANCILQCRIF